MIKTETWTDAGSVDDLTPGNCLSVDVDGQPVAIFNIDGRFYAIEDECSHESEMLSGGTVDGLEIICPRHEARFSLVSGDALSPPACEPVAIFPVRVVDGRIQVRDDRFD